MKTRELMDRVLAVLGADADTEAVPEPEPDEPEIWLPPNKNEAYQRHVRECTARAEGRGKL